MDPSLPNPAIPQPVRSPGGSKNNTLLYLLLGLFLLVVVTALLYFKVIPIQNPKSTSQPNATPKPQPISITGLEVAKKTATFLDKTIIADGSFNRFYGCNNESKKCTFVDNPVIPNLIGIPTGKMILAYHELFKKTQDKSYEDKAQKALELYLQKCQTDNNSCVLNILAFDSYYKETGDIRFKDAILKVANEYSDAGKSVADYLHPYLLPYTGTKLSLLYDITGDKKYADKLEQLAKEALTGVLDNNKDNPVVFKLKTGQTDILVRKLDSHLTADLYLSAYKVSKNSVYLKPIIAYLEKINMIISLNSFPQFAKEAGVNIDVIDRIAEVALSLADINDPSLSANASSSYSTEAHTIEEALLTFWDTPEHRLYTGDYGFIRSSDIQSNSKDPLLNASRILLFLKMGTQQFNVPLSP